MYDKPPFAVRRQPQPRRDRAQRRSSASRSSTCGRRCSRAAAGTLSGGNQQKVVLARELSRPLKLLIVAQPTRGLDVGSMEFVHRRIVQRTRRGHGGRAGLDRTGRGARTRRPDRGDVPRPDRRRGAGGDAGRADRPADGRARPRHGRGSAGRRGMTRSDGQGRRGRAEPRRAARTSSCPQRRRGRAGACSTRTSTADRASSPLLAFVVRAGVRRDPDRDRRRADADVARLLLPAPDGHVQRTPGARSRRPTRRCSAARSSTPNSLYSNGGVPIFRPISDTLVNAAPLILGGLAVAVAFRAGLFNIGVQGQLIMGAIAAGYVGFAWHLPIGHPPARRAARRHPRRRDLGRHRRLAQGADRRARGDHDDHAQLRRRTTSSATCSASTASRRRTRHEATSQLHRQLGAAAAPVRRTCTPGSSSRSSPRSGCWWLLSRSTLGFTSARRSARTRSPRAPPA